MRRSIAELRETVRSAVDALAKEDAQTKGGSREAFASLEAILENLGWLNNFTSTTCRRMRKGISALVGTERYREVYGAAQQAAIELRAQTHRLARMKGPKHGHR